MQESFPFDIGTVHIIGIGGIGMSGYAEVLHLLGYKVQGSDMAENANIVRLRDMGVRISVGHRADNIYDANGNQCDVVVKSTAVKDNNVEIVAAKDMGIPVIPRVELLAEIMRSKWCINISGTHGKTTTTSVIGHLLEHNGQDPTIINGGIISSYGSNARIGTSDWMVVEADESDGTFAKLPSVASIITNIDPEHLDYYKTFENAKKAFLDYAHALPFYGFVVACIDHPIVRELMPHFQRKTFTYGFSDDADIRAVNVRPQKDGILFDVKFGKQMVKFPTEVQDVKIPLFGKHNVLNSLTCFAIGYELGFNLEKIIETMATIPSVKRRFTRVGVVNDITVIDDYAHHPSEIEAVMKAGRDVIAGKGEGRIVAVFQPHRYTRASNLFENFCKCFADADEVVVLDVYAAGEDPIAGISKEHFAEGIIKESGKPAHVLIEKHELPEMIYKIARPGDLVICLGAGDITKLAYALPQALEDKALGSSGGVNANGGV